jgi:hypothetical protein
MPDTSRPTTRDLVLVPAIITLAVTVLRLVGELQQWSPRLFSRAGGGGAALVGISWLPLIFGVYFAARLARVGEWPQRMGRAIGFAFLGLAIVPASLFAAGRLKVPQLGLIVVACIAFLVGGWVASRTRRAHSGRAAHAARHHRQMGHALRCAAAELPRHGAGGNMGRDRLVPADDAVDRMDARGRGPDRVDHGRAHARQAPAGRRDSRLRPHASPRSNAGACLPANWRGGHPRCTLLYFRCGS